MWLKKKKLLSKPINKLTRKCFVLLLLSFLTTMTLLRVPTSLSFVGWSSSMTQFPSTTNLNSYSPGGKSSLRAHFSSQELFSISTGFHCEAGKDPANWTFSTTVPWLFFHSNETAIFHKKDDDDVGTFLSFLFGLSQ